MFTRESFRSSTLRNHEMFNGNVDLMLRKSLLLLLALLQNRSIVSDNAD